MKKYLTFAMFLVLAVVLISPFSVSAKTKAGTKPGSFFYFFDKAFEKADLFFTFSPEKKAKKALENAEERLAEAEESASENNQEAAAEAMKDYQENISLAEMKAKAIKDEIKTKELLSNIASSTSKHQEVLEKVLSKVPAEAKQAIQKAIEASKKRRGEADEEITKPKKEVSEIKQEFKETENEKEANNKNEQEKEIEKLKKEVETLKQKQPQVKIIEKVEKIIEKPVVVEKTQSSSSQEKQNENIVTLPNGSVVEMDTSGNIVKTIKEVEATPQVSTFKHVIVNAPQYVSREIKKGQTNAPLISLRLQSVGNTPVRVDEVNIRIVGPVVVIKTVKIENCGIAQPLSDKGEATLVCPLSIKNGSSNNYNIVADISDDISSENGKTIQVSVESIKAEDAVISGEFPIVSALHKIIAPPIPTQEDKKQEEISKQQNSSASTPLPTLTYEQLHCPRFYKLEDSLGNTRETTQNIEDRTGIPGIGGSFVKGKVSSIALKVFTYDPDGDALQYRLSVFADGFQPPDRYAWSANNEFNINILNSIGLGPHKWIYIDVSDGDSFNCAATNIDSNAYFSYTVYPE